MQHEAALAHFASSELNRTSSLLIMANQCGDGHRNYESASHRRMSSQQPVTSAYCQS